MIKRTPQEIADFFKCYVAMDADGEWVMYEEKPKRFDVYWNLPNGHSQSLFESFIEDIENHDWKDSLHEPSTKDAPHISEVHTHMEYQVVTDPDAGELFKRINALLSKGWRPQGGIAVEHLESNEDDPSGYILYQAMVRGIE